MHKSEKAYQEVNPLKPLQEMFRCINFLFETILNIISIFLRFETYPLFSFLFFSFVGGDDDEMMQHGFKMKRN